MKEFLSDAEKISSYADPNRLVTTDWLAKNLDRVTVIESDEDVLLYESGHIPGSIKVDWHTDLNDTVLRDYLSPEKFRDMCVSKGISDNDIIVFTETSQTGGQRTRRGYFACTVTITGSYLMVDVINGYRRVAR